MTYDDRATRHQRPLLRAMLVLLALFLSACGGSGEAEQQTATTARSDQTRTGAEDTQAPTTAASTAGVTPTGSSESSGGSAVVVTFNGEIHEFSDAECTTSASTVITFGSFEAGADRGSMIVTGEEFAWNVSLTIDGGDWFPTEGQDAPVKSGSTYSWSGKLQDLSGSGRADGEIVVNC